MKTEDCPPPDPNAPSEALFERLAWQDPDQLVRVLRSNLEPALLTYAAEIAGQQLASESVVSVLLDLLEHPSPLVREGAVYGLSSHEGPNVDAALDNLSKTDPSPGVRTAARDALGPEGHKSTVCPSELGITGLSPEESSMAEQGLIHLSTARETEDLFPAAADAMRNKADAMRDLLVKLIKARK